jgi:hypothetical protein
MTKTRLSKTGLILIGITIILYLAGNALWIGFGALGCVVELAAWVVWLMEGKNMDNSYKLYYGEKCSYHKSFEAAKEEAKRYMPNNTELRIEIMCDIEPGMADYWAYEYEINKWVPS